ncbi:MAG: methylenetetrahydrofolate reductase C-terminal domain-containing protein [Pseudomonadota bacterium]|nr:methylenetetrahydrofolate reductase C-terminal domain-containing protein [Pseudomonadota bacterium]
MSAMSPNRFREALSNPAVFPVSWEVVPGRGAREAAQERVVRLAGQAASGGMIHALTLTDNPGGTPAMSADFMGAEILALGIEPVVHFTCKDKNRNAIESQLYALARAGVRNLLAMSGDYPVSGHQGRPAPVFDLDPAHVLQLITELNRGPEHPQTKGIILSHPCDFFAGAVVSPFKATEAEQMAQYYKLKKKIAAGAQFIVTQLGYDARKFHEALLYMKQNHSDIPLVGNIYILPYGAARMMNRNELPGSVVTDKLLADIDRERSDPDKGLRARLLRAARMYAILKGMGYNGVHIGGHNVAYEQVVEVIRQGEALVPQWTDLVRHFDYPLPDGFYYYERDPETGLNREKPAERRRRSGESGGDCAYRLALFMHWLLYEPGKNLHGAMKTLCGRIAGTGLERVFHRLEHLVKVVLFDCRDCGDCALAETAYLCPMSQCPKNQRNGACGGSYQGWCEVYQGKRECVYVRAYHRLRRRGREGQLAEGIVPPCNWDLYQTSSWINYYLGKDHAAKGQGGKSPGAGATGP